ncbi:unnamed protein product [Owenia fusiformis]|uniref:Uncharacterized protein n=1 Tax=Owenia fusiformis TaxID=6347 RepID=A0A8J1Y059_OWEFU|nr:unnamed protein product [Owenia fusiformis]
MSDAPTDAHGREMATKAEMTEIQAMSVKSLTACLLNISEARRWKVVETVANAALNSNSAGECKAAVLNIFNDIDYNRSVITIVAPLTQLIESVTNACVVAFQHINLADHSGGHPRLGAVDLIPIHPISEDVTLQDCGKAAQEIAKELSSKVPGSSYFLFGHADHLDRGLVKRRKELKWFSGKSKMDYSTLESDIGCSPTSRFGLTGIGAIPYVMNCNVTMESTDLKLGRHIAKKIRGSTPGGLPGVQTMAFPHEGNIEIACNVESFNSEKLPLGQNMTNFVKTFGGCFYTSGKTIQERVKDLASKESVRVHDAAIIGFRPEEARELAIEALNSGRYDYWKYRTQRQM